MAIFFFAGSLAACQGMVPQGAGPAGPTSVFSTPSAQKEATPDATADVPSTDTPSDAGATTGGASAAPAPPPPPPTDMIAVNDKPHSGGVSALPADVGGGDDAKTPFKFTLSGTADAVCTEPSPEKELAWYAWAAPVRYHVTGTVGAVLLDGTAVPLSGCGQVVVRFQQGAGSSAHCDDVRVGEDCQFNMYVSLRHNDQAKAYLYTHLFAPGVSIPPDYKPCGEPGDLSVPGKDDITFAPANDPLPVCTSSTIDDSILNNSSIKKKLAP